MSSTAEDRVSDALALVMKGVPEGDHHRAWFLDQVVRVLTGCPVEGFKVDGVAYEMWGESEEYRRFVAEYEDGEDGPGTYSWDTGVAP